MALQQLFAKTRILNDRDLDSRFITRFVAVVMWFIVWVLIIVGRLVALMVPASTSKLGDHAKQISIISLVIAFGFLAHEFKRWDQYLYGQVEVGFGISSAIILVFSLAPAEMHLTQWASLIGAAYVIARGRNNIHDATLNPNSSRFLRWVRSDTDSFSTS